VTLFRYDPRVLERFPTIVGGLVHAQGVSNGHSPPALAAEFHAEQERTLARLGGRPLGQVPSLAAWRRAFTGFGVEPTRYRSAAEALLRRLTKQGEVPSVGLLVDIGNIVSIRYALPVALFDVAGVAGTITVRFAEGSEVFTDLGTESVERPDRGEVIFADATALVHARRWCWRQSALSAVGPDTEKVLIAVEGHHETAAEDVAQALALLERLLTDHASPTTLDSRLLTSAHPSFP
jgi:DNA/RNA-binding domain of Phe-tRNA-synthetase-like protein